MRYSCGYDEIPSKVIKCSLPCIISPLVYICNMSLINGIFPTRLKFSQLNPLFKKGINWKWQITDLFPY